MTIHQIEQGMDVAIWDNKMEKATKSKVISVEKMPEDHLLYHQNGENKNWMQFYGFICVLEGIEKKIPVSKIYPWTPTTTFLSSLNNLNK